MGKFSRDQKFRLYCYYQKTLMDYFIQSNKDYHPDTSMFDIINKEIALRSREAYDYYMEQLSTGRKKEDIAVESINTLLKGLH